MGMASKMVRISKEERVAIGIVISHLLMGTALPAYPLCDILQHLLDKSEGEKQ